MCIEDYRKVFTFQNDKQANFSPPQSQKLKNWEFGYFYMFLYPGPKSLIKLIIINFKWLQQKLSR